MKIGKRYTSARKKVFTAIGSFDHPVTAGEIYQYIKEHYEEVDLASVYRTLELMKQSDVVNIILFGEGKKRYELKDKEGHHHHFYCEKCGDIKDIEMKEENLLEGIKNKRGYVIKKHNLEFFGLCPKCQ
jgi:Fe2+ or Zn2+ uptake regulation protein